MIERVLNACAAERGEGDGADLASVLTLLRRFAVEAAREEARMFCDDLVANDQQQLPLPRLGDTPRLVA
jgi:hypothetical protein